MTDNLEILRSRATLLRERCVAAHNRLIRDASYSPVGALMRSLVPGTKLGTDSPQLRLVSSYTFWGDRGLGGSRRGFEKRLRRIAGGAERELHERLKKSRFGAWECLDAGGDDAPSRWRSVGTDDEQIYDVELVLDGNFDVVEPAGGQVWAGLRVEWEGAQVLAAGLHVPEEGAKSLHSAAEQRGWHDETLDDDKQFQRLEYHRDVIIQSIRPDWEQCGLEEHYFLPPNQRHVFPKKFRKTLPRALTSRFRRDYPTWQMLLAARSEGYYRDEMPGLLDEVRKKAAEFTHSMRGGRPEDGQLRKLMPDSEILGWAGLNPDGSLMNRCYRPLETHPMELLALDQQWYESTGVSPRTTIGQAREQFEGDDSMTGKQFHRACHKHRTRLRLAAILEHVEQNREGETPTRLRAGYEELRKIINRYFDPEITTMSIGQLLDGRGRVSTRMTTVLQNAELGDEPRLVNQLPMQRHSLLGIPGVGRASAEEVTDALRDAILDWTPDFGGPVEDDAEAREDIEAGLDELEELF